MICLSLSVMASNTMGFTSTPLFSPVSRTPLHLESLTTTTSLQLSKTKASSYSLSTSTLPRLTPDQEQELLRQAVELRRLNQLESELALQNRGQLPLLSIRAKAAGYGDELEAYEQAKYQGQKAREELVTRNMALVNFCVSQILQKTKTSSLSRDDLIQEGAIGLARAVDKYNPAIGGKLSSYAVYWIRAAVLRCIAERDDLLRVPNHVSSAVHEINKAAKRLGMDLDVSGNNTWKQAKEAKRLAEEAGLSERNFEEAMKVRYRRYTGGYVAFESWMQKGENLETDSPVLGAAASPTAELEREQLRKTLSKFLQPKEMEALSWRYGLVDDGIIEESTTPQQRANQYLAKAEEHLFGATSTKKKVVKESAPSAIPAKGRFGEAMTFNEVAKKMKVSAEYTRRLCQNALTKLQQAAEDGRLEPALLY